MNTSTLLEISGLSKSFPGVRALHDMQLQIRSGEVHALAGENGAGKSTLIKILSGVLGGWTGTIRWDGEPVSLRTARDAQRLGIATVHQELTVCTNMTVAENMYLGREPRLLAGWIDRKRMNRDARDILAGLNLAIDPTAEMSTLSVAYRQLVEIARALTMNARLIIMDEPTSSLSEHEVQTLLQAVRELSAKGIAVLYISHKFEEIFSVCQRISVIRDGEYIDTVDTVDTQTSDIISKMVGRELSSMFPTRTSKPGATALSVRGLTNEPKFRDIAFDLHAGEILGVAGLVGAGRTELARAIFGIDRAQRGQIDVGRGWRALPASTFEALSLGIGLLPEDRKGQGLVLERSVAENVVLAAAAQRGSRYFTDFRAERTLVDGYLQQLRVKTPSIDQLVVNLSGGNQQKVVISKWLATQSQILIFDEPTRGIDVGAKTEIYDLMNRLAQEGCAILMISSDLLEIVGMSDRVLVMREGSAVAILEGQDIDPETVMSHATGAQ